MRGGGLVCLSCLLPSARAPAPPQGYAVHETMALTAEFDTLLLQPGVPNVLDFGRVHLNDRAIRTIVLANSGRYNFDFKWASPASRFLSVTPDRGRPRRGQVALNSPTVDPELSAFEPQKVKRRESLLSQLWLRTCRWVFWGVMLPRRVLGSHVRINLDGCRVTVAERAPPPPWGRWPKGRSA